MDSYTVSELNEVIKKAIQSEFKNKSITVSGEISNLKKSGKHSFLTLKDDNSTLSVAFWSHSLNNEHGDHVEITGKLDYYTKTSNINLIGSTIKIIGIGSLHTQYEKLRNEYEKKGYFNNKKSLPSTVKNIGVVTAMGGAALQDFVYVLKKNYFSGNVYVYDCSVQGIKCPASVSAGIKFFNSRFYVSTNLSESEESDEQLSDSNFDPFVIPSLTNSNNQSESQCNNKYSNAFEVEVDIIVITRGGGSFEDLMGFSNPKIIECIYTSKKYTISAVGHEIDNMLSDFVANYRAPTPSVAGEVIVSINNNNKLKFDKLKNDLINIKHNIIQSLYKYRDYLKYIENSIENPAQTLDIKLNSLYNNALSHCQDYLSVYLKKINSIKNSLASNDTNSMLKHGFLVLTNKKGNIITSAEDIFDKNINMIHISGKYEVKIKIIKQKKSNKN